MLSDAAHLFVRLRIWHPTLALVVGGWISLAVLHALSRRPSAIVRRLVYAVLVAYGLQLLAGAVNVWFLAPVALQLAHLLLSDLIWILLIVLMACLFAVPDPGITPGAPPVALECS